jgi:ribulose-5-phosphate 4-epimerase/fuculose-1-phosphate aldolase
MILRNQGLLACGPSVPEAFNTLYQLETCCRAQVQALPPIPPAAALRRRTSST